MTTRDDIAAEARRWLGTPYHPQASIKGVGCDCGTLMGGMAVELGIVSADFWQTSFAKHAGYSQQAYAGSLIRVLRDFMPEIEPAAAIAGDVVVMKFATEPQHVGVLVPYAHGGLALLHAWNGSNVRKVVEHRLDERWRARVTNAFAFPGVT